MENLTRRCKERCLGTSLEYCMGWAKETRFFWGGGGRWCVDPVLRIKLYIYIWHVIYLYIYTCILCRYILYLYVYICIYICAYIGFFNPKLINGVAWSPLGWNDSEWFLMWMMMCQFFSLCPTVPHRIMSFCRKWPFLVQEKAILFLEVPVFHWPRWEWSYPRLDSHVSTIQQQTHPSHWIKQTSRDLHRFRGFPKNHPPRTLTIIVIGLRSCDWNWMGHLHRKMATFCGHFFVWEQTRRQ